MGCCPSRPDPSRTEDDLESYRTRPVPLPAHTRSVSTPSLQGNQPRYHPKAHHPYHKPNPGVHGSRESLPRFESPKPAPARPRIPAEVPRKNVMGGDVYIVYQDNRQENTQINQKGGAGYIAGASNDSHAAKKQAESDAAASGGWTKTLLMGGAAVGAALVAGYVTGSSRSGPSKQVRVAS